MLSFIVGASEVTIIVVVILLSAIFTEFTSNLACASILFPIFHSIVSEILFNHSRSNSLCVSGEDNWNACRSADHAFVYGCVVVIHVAHR